MARIKASDAHLHVGRLIRVVYNGPGKIGDIGGHAAIILDSYITDPVLLKKIDTTTVEVEIERQGGKVEKIKFRELLPAD